jgi:glycosyltransferase involved in cell wall biosynthesis
MKIAHLLPHFFSAAGGLQVCVHNICLRHAQAGHSPHLFCCDAPPDTATRPYTVTDFRNFRGVTRGWPLLKRLIQRYVAGLQRRHNFDLWQIDGGYPYGAALADYFQTSGIPAVLRCSGDDIQVSNEFDYGVRRNPKVDRIIRATYPKYSALVAITESVVQEYRELGVTEERIARIPNGVAPERFAPIPGEDIRKKHGVPPGAKLLLSVGRNHPKKGYAYIPAILRGLLEQGLDVYWLVVGKGCGELKKLVEGAEAERLLCVEEIPFSGQGHDVPSQALVQYYLQADLFVLTSMLETFGIVILEAMAAGLPVVCFDAPGVRDVMRPECGAICPAGDVQTMTHAVGHLLTASSTADIAEHCRAQAADHSWDRIAADYLDLYKQLLP